MHAGQYLVPGLLFIVIGMALIALARFWPSRRPVAAGPAPAAELTGPVVARTRTITWTSRVQAADDDASRLRAIEQLASAGNAHSAAVLAHAFDEEDADLRVAAITALAQCDGETVLPTLERAYASPVVAERYAAIDGASRRGDLALLEHGLRDTDGTVALGAAYGLWLAGRSDVVDAALTSRDDARAGEIRRLLPMLTA